MTIGFDSMGAVVDQRKRLWICKALFVQHLKLNVKIRMWQRIRKAFYLRNV